MSASRLLSGRHPNRPWHFLYFFPLPHGHGSFRPTVSPPCSGASGRSTCWVGLASGRWSAVAATPVAASPGALSAGAARGAPEAAMGPPAGATLPVPAS